MIRYQTSLMRLCTDARGIYMGCMDVPGPPSVPLTHSMSVTQVQHALDGRHPMGRPLRAERGATCGDCLHRRCWGLGHKTYNKCVLMGWTRGPGTDIPRPVAGL